MIECRPGARLWGLDDEDSVWEVGIDLFLLNRGNAYDGLACLFGIRNYFGFRPLAEDRGFPDDASEGLRDEFARYGGPHDVHGTTWLTWAELETTDWQEADASGTRTRAARRLEVYDRSIERFGSERVAVTGMPETWRARHALRDTGLALGLPPRTVDRIAKSFPHIRACDIRGALKELPELRQLAAEADSYSPLWELAEGLDALPGGIAMHPCGVILSNATLLDRLPVQPTRGGQYPMVQADKEDVEDLGLLKLDVLGVRMQSAMAHAVTEIRRTTGRQIDLDNPDHVPLDDQFAFALIQDSDTVGMFQLESPGQQDLVGRLQPRDPQDVIADISLFRPGPVQGGMPARVAALAVSPADLSHYKRAGSTASEIVIKGRRVAFRSRSCDGGHNRFGTWATVRSRVSDLELRGHAGRDTVTRSRRTWSGSCIST